MTGTAEPTGRCYCGCGKLVGYGRYFAAGHDKTAEAAFLALHHNGTVAQMLHDHGYRAVADRDDAKSVTKAAVDQKLWQECPKGCGYRGARESINNHVNRHHKEN
ncbi:MULTISPECIES: hypothetical protein [unclassified Streptomyces]|uniref:hypothetical protein n=1 Tax=unclassified Streptomyces TaxID=2593676 RepID=UPI000805850E|nr:MULTISPECIES: hypothetical protein [unclassified Streptomyces]MYR75153.1 hypothetical protein [Streptomyces sp. SID4925]SBU98060.1 hypothetical protein YUMDRAFT_06026 [Streptomyces sp. OspMP-M45]